MSVLTSKELYLDLETFLCESTNGTLTTIPVITMTTPTGSSQSFFVEDIPMSAWQKVETDCHSGQSDFDVPISRTLSQKWFPEQLPSLSPDHQPGAGDFGSRGN